MHHTNFSLKNIKGEIWKDITGYEGRYQVSNMGRVKSLEKIQVKSKGGVVKLPCKIMVQSIPKFKGKEYLQLGFRINGKWTTHKVHRLVAKAFVPNPENKPQVNHKKGIKTDNRASELEWVTNSENQTHAHKIGLISKINIIPPRGKEHHLTHLTDANVIEIRQRYNLGECLYLLAKEYRITYSAIRLLATGKSWKHLNTPETGPRKFRIKKKI